VRREREDAEVNSIAAACAPLLLVACASTGTPPSPDPVPAPAEDPPPLAAAIAEPAATPAAVAGIESVATAEPAPPTPASAPALPAAWIHPDSEMRFPDVAAGFLRTEPRRYSGPANWSCSYEREGTPHIVTVYCYPADRWSASWGVDEDSMPPDVREASRLLGAYLAARQMFHHVRAQTIEAGGGTPDGEVTTLELLRDGRRFHGWRGDHFAELAAGGNTAPVRSSVLLFPQCDGWSVKVRWTRPRDYGGEAEFAELLRAFGIAAAAR
jgi:hypothetical protein